MFIVRIIEVKNHTEIYHYRKNFENLNLDIVRDFLDDQKNSDSDDPENYKIADEKIAA